MRYFLFFLLISFNSCIDTAKEEARKLNNQAMDSLDINPDESMALTDSSLSLDSTNIAVYFNRVGIFMSKGDYPKALKELLSIEKYEPTNAEAIVFEGLLYEMTGNKEMANSKYNKGVEISQIRIKKMSSNQDNYKFYSTMCGVYLILSGKEIQGKNLIKNVLKIDSNYVIAKEFYNKSVEEIKLKMLHKPSSN